MQLLEELIEVFSCEVAVTVTLSVVPPTASDGIVTLRVEVPLLPADILVSEVGERLGDHPALSVTVRV